MSANKKPIRGTMPGQTHVVGPGGKGAAEFASWYRSHSAEVWASLDLRAVETLAKAVEACETSGKTVYVMGNGGSAATSSHIATDFSKTAAVAGRTPVKCISLADNNAYITAIGNDLSFADIFSRQLENLLEPGDLVLMVTGSGNSENLVRAAELAKKRKATTAALLGFDGGRLKSMVDIPILVASDQYGVIEDLHMSIGHIVTFYLKQRK